MLSKKSVLYLFDKNSKCASCLVVNKIITDAMRFININTTRRFVSYFVLLFRLVENCGIFHSCTLQNSTTRS